MFFSSSAKRLTISEFEQFSACPDFHEKAIIGKSLFGSRRFKAISSISIQRYSGKTESIVKDFKKALSQEYGDDIANFVFSQEHEQATLSQGRTKKTITAVLKKAAALEETHLLSYQQALRTKHDATIKVVEKLKETPCYEEAQKKYQAIQQQLREFDETLTNFELGLKSDQQHRNTLQDYFQEKLSYVDDLVRSIVTLSDAEEKIKKIFGDAERSQEMLKIFLQHQEVMEELRDQLKGEVDGTWHSSTVRAVMMEVSNSLDPLVRTIEKAAATLSSFSNHFHEENSSSYFSLNQRGEVIIQAQVVQSPSAQHAQEHAATIFFDALKKCYGANFINELRLEAAQNHPLTVGEAIELFQKIHESFDNLAAFFQKQPLLITKKYVDLLCDHPHLAKQVERDDQQLKARERSLVQSMRRMISTSIIGVGHYAASSSYSLIAGAHASHLVVIGAVGGSLAVAALIGAAIGGTVMLVSGHEREQMQAAGVSAIFTMEGTLGEIVTTMIFPHGNFISHFLRSVIIGGGMAWPVNATAIVNATRNAFIGGNVSGALVPGEEAQYETASSSHAQADHEEIDIEDEVSLEARLGIKYVLSVAWNVAANNLSKLVKALDRIPVDAASIKVLRSSRPNL